MNKTNKMNNTMKEKEKTMKTTKKTALLGIATVTALALLLGAGSANAATKRDVIADAQAICNAAPTDPNIQAACTLVFKTNGWQILGNGCNTMFDGTDNGVVDYLLRNCDQNEEALLRKASSAVLSLYDYIVKGKANQGCVAVGYLTTYHDNYLLLQSAGKLVSTEDLAADAQDIVTALGLTCP